MVELDDVVKIKEILEIIKKLKYTYTTGGGESYAISVPLFMEELTKLKTHKDMVFGVKI